MISQRHQDMQLETYKFSDQWIYAQRQRSHTTRQTVNKHFETHYMPDHEYGSSMRWDRRSTTGKREWRGERKITPTFGTAQQRSS